MPSPMIVAFVYCLSLHLLFAALVVVSICLGALFTMTGAVLLTVMSADPAIARRELREALALLAFGVAGFLWGAVCLPGLLL